MHRVFTPEDDSFRWYDLGHLPNVCDLFFDLAENLSDRHISRELNAVIAPKKDEYGNLIEVPLPPGFQVDPVKLLLRIAQFRHYRSNRLPKSRDNVITVSRISGAAGLALHRRNPVTQPEQAEQLRLIYQSIHSKAGSSYLDVIDPEYSEKNKRIIDSYTSLGKLIVGDDYYFYNPT